MVFTRNQKRKGEDLLQSSPSGDQDNKPQPDIHLEKETSNMKLVKRRRITKGQSQHEPQVTTSNSEVTPSDSEASDSEATTSDSEPSDSEPSDSEPSEPSEPPLSNRKSGGNLEIGGYIGSFIADAIKRVITTHDQDQDQYEYEDEDIKDTRNKDEVEGERKTRDEYEKYIRNVNSIYRGKFFERVAVDEKRGTLKEHVSEEELVRLNRELEMIRDQYKHDAPSVLEVLKMNIDVSEKQRLLENIYRFANSEMLTHEYTATLRSINDKMKQFSDTELLELEKQILQTSDNSEYNDNYRQKILRSSMPFNNKVIAYKRLQVMESFETTDTSEYAKYKSWMDILLSIPFGQSVNNTNKITNDTTNDNKLIENDTIYNVRKVLDRRLSFLERPKDQIINMVTQMARNPDFNVNAIGLYGPKGTGKTNLVRSISEALGRPYRTISLGGESESSLLTGHGFTYVGSCPGRIIEILRETKCTNPIILFDELDKVSETHHGKEIIGNLIHMTDASTNNKYNYDKYFAGLEFDLSKILFVFTYNDPKKVDPILADRLFKIQIDNYSLKEKLEITRTHLIREIFNQYCFTDSDIVFEDDAINYIVESSRSEQGMRDIKRKFEIVISRVNTLMLTNPEQEIVRLKYKELYKYYHNVPKPVTIKRDHIDTLLLDSVTPSESDSRDPPFGMYI